MKSEATALFIRKFNSMNFQYEYIVHMNTQKYVKSLETIFYYVFSTNLIVRLCSF